MKTILYQPLFINPQAYFVFPQLYHIEKGDSYIEPANITGQLIINDLTQSLTSTPILNVVQDTNQVNFGLFKIGKRNTSGDNLGAFEFEFRANRTFSFGGNNVIIFADNNIVYQTKNSYNGTEIKPGSLDDTDVLIIGAAQRNVNNKIQDPYIGCHGNILIFNRTLTEYELSWVKNNMMCSKQQEPDIDL